MRARRIPGPTPLRVLFVTPECAPWVKTGGLGDVSAALPRALRALGHDVRVLMPAYRALRALPGLSRRRVLPAVGPWPEATLVDVEAEGLALTLLDCPGFYDRDGGPYADPSGLDHEDGLRRFAFLSHAAMRIATESKRPYDVLHANDWPTGLAPAWLNEVPGRRTAGVFTIHNLAFQGSFPADRAASFGMPPHWLGVEGLLHWERVCLIKAGIRYADVVTTVSPTYAREIQTPEFGCGLEGLLQSRSADLRGLLNGIDTAEWNPLTDPSLAQPYGPDTLEAKAANKQALQQRVGLQVTPEALLLGLVSRLTGQKGVDLLIESVDWLVSQGHQLVVLGMGEPPLEHALREAQLRHPGRVAVTVGFEEPLAHLIEAGSDVFLMPSRFEPCGLNQMYSQRYGTPPLVHGTGGLADSVTDAADAEAGTGFVFSPATGDALRHAIGRAHAMRQDAAAWRALQRRGMARSFDWTQTATAYEQLYRNAMTQRAERVAP